MGTYDTSINICVALKVRNFATSWTTISFSIKTLFRAAGQSSPGSPVLWILFADLDTTLDEGSVCKQDNTKTETTQMYSSIPSGIRTYGEHIVFGVWSQAAEIPCSHIRLFWFFALRKFCRCQVVKDVLRIYSGGGNVIYGSSAFSCEWKNIFRKSERKEGRNKEIYKEEI